MTPEQQIILDVLEKTGCLTEDQAFFILRSRYPSMSRSYVERVVYQLQHINKARKLPDGTITTYLFEQRDDDMISALSIMLEICRGVPETWAARKRPFKITFLAGEKLRQFGVVTVAPGAEETIGRVVESGCTGTRPRVIFCLADPERQSAVSTVLPHYFAIRDGERYSFMKGGDV